MTKIVFEKNSQILIDTALNLQEKDFVGAIKLFVKANTAYSKLCRAKLLSNNNLFEEANTLLYELLYSKQYTQNCYAQLAHNFERIGDSQTSEYYMQLIDYELNKFDVNWQNVEKQSDQSDEEDEQYDEDDEQSSYEDDDIDQTKVDAKRRVSFMSDIKKFDKLLAKENFVGAQKQLRLCEFRYHNSFEISLMYVRLFHASKQYAKLAELLAELNKKMSSESYFEITELGVLLGRLKLYQASYDVLIRFNDMPNFIKYSRLGFLLFIATYNLGRIEQAKKILDDFLAVWQTPFYNQYSSKFNKLMVFEPINDYEMLISNDIFAQKVNFLLSFADYFGIWKNKELLNAVRWTMQLDSNYIELQLVVVAKLLESNEAKTTEYLQSLLVYEHLDSVVKQKIIEGLLIKEKTCFDIVAFGIYYTFSFTASLPIILREQTIKALSVIASNFFITTQIANNIVDKAQQIQSYVAKSNFLGGEHNDLIACVIACGGVSGSIYSLFNVTYTDVAKFTEQLFD
ncbi:MAG: hypothetical protein RR248_02670 [Clostridia bacterium]